MATRDKRSRAAAVPPTRKPTTAASRVAPQAASAPPRASADGKTAGLNLPIDSHRAIASVALVMLILLTLLAPMSVATPNRAAFLTPRIDGSGSVGVGFNATGIERTVFPYLTFIERQQGNLSSTWPDIYGVINNDPSSVEAQRAIIGQIFGSTSGINVRVRDSGLESNPDPAKLSGVTFSYQQMTDTDTRENLGINGLGIVDLIHALTAPDRQEQQALERDAIVAFQTAASNDAKTWQYSYNWAIANFLVGNYTAAYEGMRAAETNTETADFHLIPVWMGLAALRNGEPDEAIKQFNRVIDFKLAAGSDENVRNSFEEARGLAQEALGDAQWARRDPATAYKTYQDTLQFGRSSAGLYRKWLRLGLQQRGYEQLLDDMNMLLGQGLATDLQGRIHHDRARLLSFMGRGDAAMSEYKQALVINQNDPPLLISYGQALLSSGDYNGALAQAEDVIRQLGKDPSAGDMATVANTVITSTSSLGLLEAGQELLDAQLLRAAAWSKQNSSQSMAAIDSLVSNITGSAAGQPTHVVGLLNLYGGNAYEMAATAASGDRASDLYGKAAEVYKQAWAALKDLPKGASGRAAALSSLARTTALTKGKSAQDGLTVLKDGGYDPAAISPEVSTDSDAPDILYAGALLLEQAGQQKEAVNAYRVSGVVRNLRDAESLTGVGRPLWMGNGTSVPAEAALQTGDAARKEPGVNPGMVVMRYKQAFALDSALAPAWNNLGVWYAQNGKPDVAKSYLSLSAAASPNYALGNHNLATEAYKSGIGNFLTAEKAQGDAIKASGPQDLRWGYNLRYDEAGPLPAPSGPQSDFLARLAALLILGLLLAHTLVGNDRLTNRMGLIPTRGVLGKLAGMLDVRVREAMPALVTPGSSSRSLLVAIGVPALIGMLGLAWGAGHGSFEVALLFLPVAFIVSALAFGANELAQRMSARRHKATTLHHLWPMGVLLGIVSIPFGFVYGWQNVTRLQVTGEHAQTEANRGGTGSRRSRTTEELDLEQEAHAEAIADSGDLVTVPVTGSLSVGGTGSLNLSPSARIIFAGMIANLLLGAVFAVIYWLTGWPTMRLGLFASMLVLAFTSVSEPPADGWTLYRRNAPLWLAVFVLASTVATLLALGLI
ncbi:MAG: tetratricopeptide repeat protein [Chloroflexota bacterium]